MRRARHRPIDLPWSRREKGLVIIGSTGAGLQAGVLLLYYNSLPEMVPLHFNLAGTVDAWGEKYFLLIFCALTIVIFSGLMILARFPYRFRYPRAITPGDAEAQYRIARRLMCWFALILVWSCGYLSWACIRGALYGVLRLPPQFLPMIVTSLLGAPAYYVRRGYRAC